MIDWLYRVTLHTGMTLLILSLLAVVFARLSPSIRCWLWRAGYLKCLATMAVALTISVPLLPATPTSSEILLPPVTSTSSYIMESIPERVPVVRSSNISVETLPPVSSAPAASFTDVLVWLYIAGVAIALLRWGYCLVRAVLLWRSATLVSVPEVAEFSKQLKLRRIPRIARHTAIPAPLYTFGGILLPETARPDESLTLAHELVHARRKDLFWEVLGGLIQVALWFHPLVWWVRRQEQLAREQATDAATLALCNVPRADYARALFSAATGQRIRAIAVGAFDRPSFLRRRVEALGKPALPSRKACIQAGFLALLAVGALLPWRAVARQIPPTKSKLRQRYPANVAHFGIVRRQDGSPIAGAQVTLQLQGRQISDSLWPDQCQWTDLASAKTAADGTFRWPGVFPDSTRIVVSAPGFATTERRGIDRVNGWRVTMQTPIRWEAVVTDENGRPFVGKRIQAKNGQSGVTDARGRFVVTGAEVANWNDKLFRLTEPGWVLRKQGLSQKPGGIVRRYMAQQGQALVGELMNHRGEPVTNVSLRVVAYERAMRERINVEFDRAGRFRTELLLPGKYYLTIAPGSLPGSKELAPKDIQHITIPDRRNIPLRVVLTPGTTVRGVVTDASTGRPLAKAVVRYTRPRYFLTENDNQGIGLPRNERLTTTDDQGRYFLQITPGENATLTAEVRGKKTSQRESSPSVVSIQAGKDGQTITRNLMVYSAQPVTGQVVDEQGRPVAKVVLSIPGNRMEQKVAVTDQKGRFSIPEDRFFAKRYILLAKKGEARGQWQASNLSFQPIQLILKAKQMVTVRGNLPEGARSAFVKLSVQQAGVSRMSNTPVKANGQFAASIEPNMPIYAEIGAPGFGTIRRTLPAAAPGSTVHLGSISLPRANGGVSGRLSDESRVWRVE